MELRGCLLVCLFVVAVSGEVDVDSDCEVDAQESTHHHIELKKPTVFDAYFGKPLKPKRKGFLEKIVNGTSLCTVLVKPCNKEEGRRVDGTCINPHYPSRGARYTPFLRLLPPIYGPGNTLRAAKDGLELPSTRLIRTTLLGDGFFTDHHWSTLSTHVFVFSFIDIIELAYLLRYAVASDCCINNRIPNVANPLCIPIPVPQDDPYLRQTGIRCMNLTRMETFQDYGCISNMLPAARYSRATPHLDLSVVYGTTEERGRQIRAMEGGLLAFKMEGDREVPAGQSPWCVGNTPPEVSCYDFGDNFNSNALTGMVLTTMWFFREHNRLARDLSAINPCWDDEKLYNTARQINIAQWQFIYYYELIGDIIGHKNAIAEGILTEHDGYVNDFDPHYSPGVYRDFVIATRYFHTFQPALLDLYRDHEYMGSRTLVDDRFRSGMLPLNNTEADLTEGAIIQPSDGFDKIIDPDLSQRVHTNSHAAADLPAIDMMRGRDAGLPPYNHYRKLCGMKVAKHFEDFEDSIDKDKVEHLRRLYDNEVDDVELMVAVYVEKHLPGTLVGPTLYCIMVQNLLHWRKSDKYFFEHGDHPTALTEDQLHAVKHTSIARILCDNGDGITAIQPKAMYRRSESNDFVSCKQIPGIDLSYWKEHTKCLPLPKPKAEDNKP